MKKMMEIATALFCAGAAANLFAEEAPKDWPVYSEVRDGMTGNQQLTNAFIQAKAGDTITIHAGTYNLSTEEMIFRYEYLDAADGQVKVHATQGTCLFSKVDNLTVQGDPNVSRDEIILTGRGAAAANATGQHQIMRLQGRHCTVKHLTLSKGFAGWTKEMYRNGKMVQSDKWVYRRGGCLSLSATSVARDCVIADGYAGHGGGAAGGEYVDCLFLRNSGNGNQKSGAIYASGGVYGCRFEDNKRGAIRSSSGMVSNCVFVANFHNADDGIFYDLGGTVIDCVFTNNSINTVFTGTQRPTALEKCRFYGNNQIVNFPGRISGCDFVRTSKAAFGVLSGCSQVEDCSFRSTLGVDSAAIETYDGGNGSVVSNSVLSRCRIEGFNVRYGWILSDVPSADNCLIEGNNIWGYSHGGIFKYSDGRAASVVNCTVVSNKCNNSFYNEGEGIVTFRNTLFFNNKIGGREWRKWDIQYSEDFGHDTIRMENSIYKSDSDFDGTASQNMYGKWDWYPQFLKDRYPDVEHEHPYAVYRKSPCVDAGANGDWTENDFDLAGNKRINGGVVDIGCYENWDRILGLMMIVR